MKVILLAGGLGTRISEETETKPKPMVQIGDRPLLEHLMDSFSDQGYLDCIIALGYKKEYILNWIVRNPKIHPVAIVEDFSECNNEYDVWNVLALDTGADTQTGGRIVQSMSQLPNERVLVTYGDGLANVDIAQLLDFHNTHGKLATVTAVRPPARFGHLEIRNNQVVHFGEKNQTDEGWINGGFFILEPEVVKFVYSDSEPFEVGALPRIAELGQLMAYHHDGFWKPMDTLRDKLELTNLSNQQALPWRTFV